MLLGREKSLLICLFANTTKAAIIAWMTTGRAMAELGGQYVFYIFHPISAEI